jgi:hypothetical protein
MKIVGYSKIDRNLFQKPRFRQVEVIASIGRILDAESEASICSVNRTLHVTAGSDKRRLVSGGVSGIGVSALSYYYRFSCTCDRMNDRSRTLLGVTFAVSQETTRRPGVSRPAPGPIDFKESEPNRCLTNAQLHFARRFDRLANSVRGNLAASPFAPRNRRSLWVGTHLASRKRRCHGFLVSHCPHNRHSSSPYLVLWAFQPSALAIPEFFSSDLLDLYPDGAVVIVHLVQQACGRLVGPT